MRERLIVIDRKGGSEKIAVLVEIARRFGMRGKGGADKIILDSKGGQGVVPYLTLDQLQKGKDVGK